MKPQTNKSSQLVAKCTLHKTSEGELDGRVVKYYQEGDVMKAVPIKKKVINEYVNSIQLYNPNMNGKEYQDYFEKDPFTKKQNEIIKVLENHVRIQKEYSIMKDTMLTKYLTDFFYPLIDKKYKGGEKKEFKLLEFFRLCSREEEIRKCYKGYTTAPPLRNSLNFKDLNVSKWDRVNWLQKRNIIKL